MSYYFPLGSIANNPIHETYRDRNYMLEIENEKLSRHIQEDLKNHIVKHSVVTPCTLKKGY